MVKKKGLGKGLNALFQDMSITKEPMDTSEKEEQENYQESTKQDWNEEQNDVEKDEKNNSKYLKKDTVNSTASHRTRENLSSEPMAKGEPLRVNIAYVEPNRNQPRKDFKEEELQELAESVRQYGIIQPILVKKIHNTQFEIIAGERRWRAAKLVGLKEVPVILKDFSDREAMEISIIENIQRMDLNPIEEAMGYKVLMDEYGLTQEEVASKVSKKRATIANALRLLKLDERVQKMTIDGLISAGHAKVLLTVENKEEQKSIADEVVLKSMSVRELERYLKVFSKPSAKIPARSLDTRDYSLFFKEYEENIRRILGTKVHINRKDKNKGRIEIDYYSEAELERIIDLIKSIG